MGDLVDELLKRGNRVTVITFSEGIKQNYLSEEKGNLTTHRIRVADRTKSRINRAFIERSYSSKIISTLRDLNNRQFDRIICYSPSIFFGKALNWLKKISDTKIYLIIRDIFPRWAVDAGLLKKGLVYYYFKWVERQLYNSVDFIGIESKSDLHYFKENIKDKEKKVEVLNNWSSQLDETEFKSNTDFFDESKINILYGGNISEAQDLSSLLKNIDQNSLKKNNASLTIIGDGVERSEIEEIVYERSLDSISVLPPIDRISYLSILSKADIGLISLNRKLKSHNFPLKMITYLQFGIPILASVNKGNEIIRFIEQKQIGLTSIAGDKLTFNKNLAEIAGNIDLRSKFKQNCKKVYKEEFTVETVINQIDNTFRL